MRFIGITPLLRFKVSVPLIAIHCIFDVVVVLKFSTSHFSAQTRNRVRRAVSEQLGFQLRANQVIAAESLLASRLAELPTGEGKTLTLALAAIELVIRGKRVLIATANDYLATRDAQAMKPVYQQLGLSVESVSSRSSEIEKRSAYSQNIVYGTLRQFGFDYLRQRLATTRVRSANECPEQLLAGPTFDVLLVDEADSVLIDEARTPLIVTAAGTAESEANRAAYGWAAEFCRNLRDGEDYVCDPDSDAVAITASTYGKLLTCQMPAQMSSLSTTAIVYYLERALWVEQRLMRDHHYVVSQNRIHLVDEFTGRSQADRTLSGGLHQAVCARESLPIEPASQTIAQITVQDFANRFSHLAGLSATLWENRRELANVYGLATCRVSAFKKQRLRIYPAKVCLGEDEKWVEIADEIERMVANGRAVLVGTRTVGKSEHLSQFLHQRGIDHVVLNARNESLEAERIRLAGQSRQVTVATNMAGRGTDIQLSPAVAAAGGLHVIVSEPHAALRIDRQLIGRSARQGDPGSARSFFCPDDEILQLAYGREAAVAIRSLLRQQLTRAAGTRRVSRQMRRAQTAVEQMHQRQRAATAWRAAQFSENLVRLGLDPVLDPVVDAE